MTLDFCKPWSEEENKLFLGALRKRKIEYCEMNGLPVPAFDKPEDFLFEPGTAQKHDPTARAGQPVTIKNFVPGQIAYMYITGGKRRGKYDTQAVEVTKVGRKYVTVETSSGMDMLFREAHRSKPYLVEHTKRGVSWLLFTSSEAVDEHCAREWLKTWVRTATGWDKIDRYTLAQLRAVKEILEREVEPGKRVYAKTTMEAMPGSCNECAFGRRYGCVGDVECRILGEYFTGNVRPPYKERPDECPLLEMEETDNDGKEL